MKIKSFNTIQPTQKWKLFDKDLKLHTHKIISLILKALFIEISQSNKYTNKCAFFLI